MLLWDRVPRINAILINATNIDNINKKRRPVAGARALRFLFILSMFWVLEYWNGEGWRLKRSGVEKGGGIFIPLP